MGVDGKFLTCLSTFPVKAGDTVYTDGRVVYGHVPIKASGAIFSPVEHLVPFFVMFYTAYDPQRPAWGGFTSNGARRLNNRKLNNVLWRNVNWMYVYGDRCYGNDAEFPLPDNGDYIDVWRVNRVVHTAEFTMTDKSWGGRTPNEPSSAASGQSVTQRHLRFYAQNFYMLEDDDLAGVHFTPVGGKVYNNAVISIKRNGVVMRTIALGDYIDTLEDLRGVYRQYDVPDTEGYKRYRHESYLDGENPDQMFRFDVWCTYIYTQLLSFAFTNDAGDWEMVLLSLCEGAVEPHVEDVEYNNETHDYDIPVYSTYSISCPVLFKVIKITSGGQKTILQERTYINALANNGVVKTEKVENVWVDAWPAARAATVTPVARVSEPYFTINQGTCSILTNLRGVKEVRDNAGRIIARDLPLIQFDRLLTTDPDAQYAVTGGAVKHYRIYQLTINRSYTENKFTYAGFNSGPDQYAPRITNSQGPWTLTYATDSESLVERTSFYEFSDGSRLLCQRNNCLILVRPNGRQETVAWYPSMLNLEMVRVGAQKHLGTMSDLMHDAE